MRHTCHVWVCRISIAEFTLSITDIQSTVRKQKACKRRHRQRSERYLKMTLSKRLNNTKKQTRKFLPSLLFFCPIVPKQYPNPKTREKQKLRNGVSTSFQSFKYWRGLRDLNSQSFRVNRAFARCFCFRGNGVASYGFNIVNVALRPHLLP